MASEEGFEEAFEEAEDIAEAMEILLRGSAPATVAMACIMLIHRLDKKDELAAFAMKLLQERIGGTILAANG
jgi:hypothetical protein